MLHHLRIIRIRMMAVIELHDVESTAVHIEVDVSLFKIRRDSFPDGNLGMKLFYCAPCRITDTLAVHFGRNEQQVEVPALAVHPDDHAADRLTVLYDPVCLTAVDSLFNRLMGNDLTVFFEVVVPEPELFQRSVVKCFLIIPDELLPVIRSQRIKCYLCHSHLL